MKKMNKTMILSFMLTLLLLGSLSVAAQDNMSGDKMNGKSMSKKDQMNSKMMSEDDMEFAKMASMGNAAEIKTARLALERSNNKDVKNFAKMIIKDHTKAGKDLQKITARNNMAQPNALSEDQTEEYNKLQAATGADFDKMYIENAGLEDHQKTIDLFQKEADQGDDAALKAFAVKTLPTLKEHLQMAQKLSSGDMMDGSMKKSSNKMKTTSNSDNR